MCHSDDKHAGTDKAYTQQHAGASRVSLSRLVLMPVVWDELCTTGLQSSRDRIGCSWRRSGGASSKGGQKK